jgi:peptidoglycan/LPS O-acetylase OafA/YrhL
VFLFGSDWYASFASYPDQDFYVFPVRINQAWTLGAELTFYAFAPILVRSLRASIAVLMLSAIYRLYFVRQYGFDITWTYHFFPSTVMFFVLGHLARLIGERFSIVRSYGVWLLASSAALSVLGLAFHQRWDNPQFYASIILFALALPGIFERTKHSKPMARIGDLSYPMYLTHKLTLTAIYELFPLVGAAIGRIDGLFAPGAASVVIVTLACILVSIAAHWLIEKPASALMRRIVAFVRPWARSPLPAAPRRA